LLLHDPPEDDRQDRRAVNSHFLSGVEVIFQSCRKQGDTMSASATQHDITAETNDDMDLVRACKNGDVAAFEQLVKRYDRKPFRIAQSVTHNREDSQDAVQEAFLKAYQHLAEFREASQFSTWLIRITLNESLMKLRKRNTAKGFSLDDDLGEDGESLPRYIADWAP